MENSVIDETGWERMTEMFDRLLQGAEPSSVLASEQDLEIRRATETLWQHHLQAAQESYLEQGVKFEVLPMFQAGQMLANRFRVEKLLGRGGMGEVYLAQDMRMEERVALKTIARLLTPSPSIRRQIVAEVQRARRVTHPNVCRIHELFDDGETVFFSMEFLEGSLLSEYPPGSFSGREARLILRQMAEGLLAAHSIGVIHGDFKPTNVMILPGRVLRAVITDFGLARAVDRTSNSSAEGAPSLRAGSAKYMAPELLLGASPSVASDVFAFGRVANSILPSGRLWEDCLRVRPEDRPASLEAVIKRLQLGITRRLLLATAVAGVSGAGVSVYVVSHRRFHPVDPRAEYHLKLGIEYSRQTSPAGIRNAIDEFKQAVAIDPQYGDGWANLADVYCMASTYSALKSRDARKLAESAAQKALALDASLAKAQAAYAYALSTDFHRWRSAESFFKRAIGLSPNDPSVRSWYAGFLGRASRFDEAVNMADSALQLDPGSFRLNYRMGTELFRAKQFDRLLQYVLGVVRLHPAEGAGFCMLERAYEWLGRLEEAEEALRHADQLPDKVVSLSYWVTLLAAKRDIKASAEITQKMRSNWLREVTETNQYLTALGGLAMATGERNYFDAMVDAMAEGIRREDETVLAAAANPYTQIGKRDARFMALLKQLDLP
jgi:serine/threonine protein kinase